MKPYSVTIGDCDLWCGDCADVLDSLPVCDLLLTDPPYGIKRKKGRWLDESRIPWDIKTPLELMQRIRNKAEHQIIFGGNYYDLPPSSCWLVWDKDTYGVDLADCELAWTNLKQAVRLKKHRWSGFLQEDMKNKEKRAHPTQKPVPVMEWCIEQAEKKKRKIETVLDPFMGSGSTGVACVLAGKRFAGIEREPEYFKIACERIATEYLKLELDL